MGWVFYKDPDGLSFDNVKDLVKDPLVRWQDQHYVPIAIFMGAIIPLAVGYLLGDGWGCFLLAGITRTVLVHHATFLINSLCHSVGERPYSLKDTARDNPLVALLTHGEGYHNFHHQFPYDYRNGFKWYHWDPTKWIIKGLAMIGWTDQLRRASDEQIFKAMVRVQKELLQQDLVRYKMQIRTVMETKIHTAYDALLNARSQWERLKVEYRRVKGSMDHKSHEIAAKLEQEMRAAKEQFLALQQAWILLVNGCLQSPA
jgi:stearoyl-CoA desaturase (Delta-9 desaturase)